MKRSTRMPVVLAPEWRALCAKGESVAISRHATFAKSADGGLSFIASTAEPDRYGDTIDQAGWVTDAFEANPVLLWAHSYSTPPVGKVGRLERGERLECKDITFTPTEMHAFGAQVGEMVRAGFLNTCSVGFIPLEWERRVSPEGETLGYHFKRCELLEVSVTPVPANPDALAERGVFAKALGDWASRHDESSSIARSWQAELQTWLKTVGDIEAKRQEEDDADAFAEMIGLLKALVSAQQSANAHLAELRRALVPVQKSTDAAVAAALETLFR